LLAAGTFLQLTITFEPPIVNQSGNMIISATLRNGVPETGVISVNFPGDMWTGDLGVFNHRLNFANINCSSLSPVKLY
jgi:hypothetical protein